MTKGECRHCGRMVGICKDGRVRMHGHEFGLQVVRGISRKECPGSFVLAVGHDDPRGEVEMAEKLSFLASLK